MDSKNSFTKSVGNGQKIVKSTGIDTSSMGDKSTSSLKNGGFGSSNRGLKPSMGGGSGSKDNC